MATIGIIALFAGIILFAISVNMDGDTKLMRNGSIILGIGGIIGGVFGTPSRDMPNGLPGAALLCIACVIIGIFLIVKNFTGSQSEKKQSTGKTPLIIIGAIFLVLVIFAFASSGGSSSSHSNEPWRDLGVSKKEYMDVYNHYKYGEPFG